LRRRPGFGEGGRENEGLDALGFFESLQNTDPPRFPPAQLRTITDSIDAHKLSLTLECCLWLRLIFEFSLHTARNMPRERALSILARDRKRHITMFAARTSNEYLDDPV
jgi:hypothetical protein